CFAEQLVGILYRELNLPCEKNATFFEKLSAPCFGELMSADILAKLHAIRIKGNDAAHNRNVDKGQCLQLVKETYLISQWIYKTYSGEFYSDYPDFVEPVDQQDSILKLGNL
ncbi:MAG TPA: hypothetical protein VLC98_18070, partial [Phnomibacter sp.]|nr:hypothetical protein [Phnomibacter sp.]